MRFTATLAIATLSLSLHAQARAVYRPRDAAFKVAPAVYARQDESYETTAAPVEGAAAEEDEEDCEDEEVEVIPSGNGENVAPYVTSASPVSSGSAVSATPAPTASASAEEEEDCDEEESEEGQVSSSAPAPAPTAKPEESVGGEDEDEDCEEEEGEETATSTSVAPVGGDNKPAPTATTPPV